MGFWRRLSLLAIFLLVVGCTQAWTKQERQEMVRDEEVPTVAIVTVDKPLPRPAPLVREPLLEEQVGLADPVLEPLPVRDEEVVKVPTEIVMAGATPAPVVRMPEPVREPSGLRYDPNPYEGKTQEYSPNRGDSVAIVAQRHFPGTKLSWVAGTFCHLNSKLMQECTEEEFRRLPADRTWIFPAWTVKSNTLASTVAKPSEATIGVADQITLRVVGEPKGSVVLETGPPPAEQDGLQIAEEKTIEEEAEEVAQGALETRPPSNGIQGSRPTEVPPGLPRWVIYFALATVVALLLFLLFSSKEVQRGVRRAVRRLRSS